MDCSGSAGILHLDGRATETRGQIAVRGARTHNLKNVDVTLPPRSLIVMTGVSGSGKSSLAFDTIYAEGQRRYVESLSAYARQFLERMEKPDVDSIEGICPAIAIRQKNSIRNPRSTVGTTTEIHDYLRLLYARVGRTFCRGCGKEVIRETAEVVAARLSALPAGHAAAHRLRHAGRDRVADGRRPEPEATRTSESADAAELDAAPPQPVLPDLVDPVAETHRHPAAQGLRPPLRGRRARSTSTTSIPSRLRDRPMLQVIVDRLKVDDEVRARLTDSIETAYTEGGGAAFAIEADPPADGAGREGLPLLGAVRVPRVQPAVRGAAAAPVLVQQPVRRLSALPRLRQHHRARHGPGRAGSGEVDPAERDRAVEQAALPRAARRAEARRQAAGAARRAVVRRSTTTRSASSSTATAAAGKGSRASSAGSSARSTRCTSACS